MIEERGRHGARTPFQPAGIGLIEMGFGRVDLSPGLRRVEARPQPPENIEHPDGVEGLGVRRSTRSEHRNDGNPELGTARKIQARRHDADDLDRTVVEGHRFPDDPRVCAKAPHPRAMIQHGDERYVRNVVLRSQSTTQHWFDAERLEERSRNTVEPDLGWLAAILNDGVPIVRSHHRGLDERRRG